MNATVQSAYVEFAVQSNFSFLRGASKPEELVVTAKLLGHSDNRPCRSQHGCGRGARLEQSKHIR